MLLKLEDPIFLAKAIEILSEMVTEVRLKVNDFGVSISAMDPANVAMVGFKLPKSAFSQFETDAEVLGVNLDSLKRILKRCRNGSSLIIEKKENMLEIQILDKIKRSFKLSLIEVESEDIDFNSKISNMEFSSKVELSSEDFIASIEDCAVVSDACAFIIKDGKFIIEAKSMNSAKSEFSSDEATINAENCKSKFSLEYLQKFMKGVKLAEKINLHFANDHPLRLDIRTVQMELSFILAPRVETED